MVAVIKSVSHRISSDFQTIYFFFFIVNWFNRRYRFDKTNRNSHGAESSRVAKHALRRKQLLLEKLVVLQRRAFCRRHARPRHVICSSPDTRVLVQPLIHQVGEHDGRQDHIQGPDHFRWR